MSIAHKSTIGILATRARCAHPQKVFSYCFFLAICLTVTLIKALQFMQFKIDTIAVCAATLFFASSQHAWATTCQMYMCRQLFAVSEARPTV